MKIYYRTDYSIINADTIVVTCITVERSSTDYNISPWAGM